MISINLGLRDKVIALWLQMLVMTSIYSDTFMNRFYFSSRELNLCLLWWQQTHSITLLPWCFMYVWYFCCLSFTSDAVGRYWKVLIRWFTVFSQVFGVIKMFLANVRWAFALLLVFTLYLYPGCYFHTLTFLMSKQTDLKWSEACSAVDVVLGIFETFWCVIDGPLESFWLIRRCCIFSPFVGNGSHSCLSHKALEMAL